MTGQPPIRKKPDPKIPVARRLRRDATDAEKKLWGLLRDRRLAGVKFRRQMPIGPYVADFACYAHKLVIELDGGQHALQANRDAARTRYIEARRFRVMRFWNNDVLRNPEGILTMVLLELKRQSSD